MVVSCHPDPSARDRDDLDLAVRADAPVYPSPVFSRMNVVILVFENADPDRVRRAAGPPLPRPDSLGTASRPLVLSATRAAILDRANRPARQAEKACFSSTLRAPEVNSRRSRLALPRRERGQYCGRTATERGSYSNGLKFD
jgi:hypothetical protein